jgi:PD-(D/E)XK nuclease superfamily
VDLHSLREIAGAVKEITRTDWQNLPVGYLSPSQVWAYISCPACYEAERILKIPKPMSADLMVGRFAHAALARMRDDLPAMIAPPTGADENVWIEAGSQAFDEVITRQVDVDNEGDETPIEIELTKKYTDLGAAKDAAVRLTRFALPIIAAYDRKAGVLASEARVRHLGKAFAGYPELYDKLSDEEREDADDEGREQFVDGVQPCFPFPVKAFLDVIYNNGVLKDAKTSSRNGSPDNLAAIQLLMYGMPWWAAGQPQKLGWDVMIKTKSPDFAAYWWRGDGVALDEDYECVLEAADDICAGRFPANNGSMFCKFLHMTGKGERAIEDNWAVPT